MNYMDKNQNLNHCMRIYKNSFMAGPDARYSRTIMNIENATTISKKNNRCIFEFTL